MKDDDIHLEKCFKHITKGRKKQLVLFLDNLDQRDFDLQQNAFVIAQELAQHWPVTVFLTMRPQTFYRSKKQGTLSGYHLKAFTISPPRVDDVLIKRLSYAKSITSGKLQLTSSHRGVSLNLPSLESYLDVLLYSFNNNDSLVEFIDNISNGNIRLALDIVKTFIGSGHVNTEEILKIEEKYRREGSKDHYLIPIHHFVRAVIFLDGEHYDPQASIIANMFDISKPDPREHFLLSILIEYIHRSSDRPNSLGFIEIENVYEYLQSVAFRSSQIDICLHRAIQKNLIETEARKIPESERDLPRVVRATPVGIYHYAKLIRQFSYLDAMIIDTPVLEESYRSKILDVSRIEERLKRALVFLEYLDLQWKNVKIDSSSFDWVSISQDIKKQIDIINSRLSDKFGPTLFD